jgi:hypothetical protein
MGHRGNSPELIGRRRVTKLRLRYGGLKALASGTVADPNWRQIRLFMFISPVVAQNRKASCNETITTFVLWVWLCFEKSSRRRNGVHTWEVIEASNEGAFA